MCIHLCVLVRIPQRAKTPPTGIRYPKWCQCSPCEWCCISASLCRERNVNGSIREISGKNRCLSMAGRVSPSQKKLKAKTRAASAEPALACGVGVRRSNAVPPRGAIDSARAQRRSRAASSKRRPRPRPTPPGLESMFTLREASGQADRDGAAGHAWPGSKRRTRHDPLDAKRRFGRGTPSESRCRGMPRFDDSRRSKAFQLHDSRPSDRAGGCSGRALGG